MIRIVADSTIDLPTGAQAKYDIGIVPINIQFGTQTFREGLDIDQHQFYARVAAEHHLPKTSQPSPGEFIDAYRKLGAKADPIIPMHATGQLSGTCQSAQLAATQIKDEFDVRVFDSLSGSAGLGVLFGLNIPACAAPLLAALLAAAAATGASGATVTAGFTSLAVFGFALSAPLVAAVFSARARRLLDWLAHQAARFPKWTGAILIALGTWSIVFGLYARVPLQ